MYHNRPTGSQVPCGLNIEMPLYTSTGYPVQIETEGLLKRVRCIDFQLQRTYGCIEFKKINRQDFIIWEHSLKMKLKKKTIFLDRISILPEMRGEGIANVLMLEAMKIVDSSDFALLTNIYPYDRGTDFDQLIELFTRFEFSLIYKNTLSKGNEYGAMYRPSYSQRNAE